MGQPAHGGQVVVVIPGAIRAVESEPIEHVLVIEEGKRPVVLGQGVLYAVLDKVGPVLRRIPVVNRCLVEVRLDEGAQVEQVPALRPDRQEVTAASDDFRRGPGIEISHHLLMQVLGIRRVEDANARVIGVEALEHLLRHRREPIRTPVLVDQLRRVAVQRALPWRARGTCAEAGPARRQAYHLQERSAGQTPPLREAHHSPPLARTLKMAYAYEGTLSDDCPIGLTGPPLSLPGSIMPEIIRIFKPVQPVGRTGDRPPLRRLSGSIGASEEP